ncbi:MAG: hypothetical protein H8D67_25355 [Deltaproteobacteria bacterium]|nr:hypothetical protein [Deltaproteobacteria bacterium]
MNPREGVFGIGKISTNNSIMGIGRIHRFVSVGVLIDKCIFNAKVSRGVRGAIAFCEAFRGETKPSASGIENGFT